MIILRMVTLNGFLQCMYFYTIPRLSSLVTRQYLIVIVINISVFKCGGDTLEDQCLTQDDVVVIIAKCTAFIEAHGKDLSSMRSHHINYLFITYVVKSESVIHLVKDMCINSNMLVL